MSDMINRQDAIDALIKMLSDCFYADEEVLDAVKTTLNELPSAEPQEHKTGRWVWSDGARCSNCNYKLQTTGLPTVCPNCGAKMEVEHETD